MDLVFHCQFIEKPDKCQWPVLQDTQAYLVIATESWKLGPSQGISMCCFFDFYCLTFNWTNRPFISNLICLFSGPTLPRQLDQQKNQQYDHYRAYDLTIFFPLSFWNAVFYLFQIASLLRYFPQTFNILWEEKYLAKIRNKRTKVIHFY